MTSSTPRGRQGFLSREDYLAPPAIPTGQSPKDVLNTIWRKNDVFLDIGSYSIGSFVMVLWPSVLTALLILWNMGGAGGENLGLTIIFSFMLGIPILILLYGLTKSVPLPVRFNRQRREVCVPFADGRYWIVPWEQVTAQAVATSSVGQHGKTTQGLLVVGFRNPDPDAPEKERDFSLGFSCGGGETAMSLWECMRSYMEIGPDAVPRDGDLEDLRGKLGKKGVFWGSLWGFVTEIRDHLLAKEFGQALWFFVSIFIFGTPLIMMVQAWKLTPPPDLTDPAIIEWSKPLPPEQWARRSAELEQAIDRQEQALQEGTVNS
ncbi:hypothetical protein GGD92_30375 [Pseudomonas protegens]|uniref:Uncharacterized protein n=1 Tax=Pseudomonas protegens TaxID=380021 RepID=A0A7G7X9F0_9PSED|nr:DUF6708 domain-containing protein [Pseudomonas protegens]QNH76595.1 hypothetical protein GGI48_25450 [Pseudomonas protegens]QNL05789.1 hypothetical protein GGD92_30375 [Pseudomonas protegens]